MLFTGPFKNGELTISLLVSDSQQFNSLNNYYQYELSSIYSVRNIDPEEPIYEEHPYRAWWRDGYVYFPTLTSFGCDAQSNCIYHYVIEQSEDLFYEFEINMPAEWANTEQMDELLDRMIFKTMEFIPFN